MPRSSKCAAANVAQRRGFGRSNRPRPPGGGFPGDGCSYGFGGNETVWYFVARGFARMYQARRRASACRCPNARVRVGCAATHPTHEIHHRVRLGAPSGSWRWFCGGGASPTLRIACRGGHLCPTCTCRVYRRHAGGEKKRTRACRLRRHTPLYVSPIYDVNQTGRPPQYAPLD